MSVASVHSDMRAAFRQRLSTQVASLPTMAWEGRIFEPTPGTPFGRETFRALNSVVRALGAGGNIAHTMLGVVTLFYPIGRGTNDIDAMAGAILAAFRPGTSLTYGSSSGMVTQAERAPLVQEPDWLGCSVTISLVSYTTL